MRGDLAELTLTHLVGGMWRAPLGTRLRAVPVPPGWAAARIVEAEAADCARAVALMRSGQKAAPAARTQIAEALLPEDLALARRAEGFSPQARMPSVRVPGAGPVLILGAPGADPGWIAAVLAESAAAGRPVMFKPAPGAAVSAALLCRALVRTGWPGLSMVQGAGATGARLLALGGWGSVLVVGAARLPEGLGAAATLVGPRGLALSG